MAKTMKEKTKAATLRAAVGNCTEKMRENFSRRIVNTAAPDRTRKCQDL